MHRTPRIDTDVDSHRPQGPSPSASESLRYGRPVTSRAAFPTNSARIPPAAPIHPWSSIPINRATPIKPPPPALVPPLPPLPDDAQDARTEVSWATNQPSSTGYTFYREGTPPPIEAPRFGSYDTQVFTRSPSKDFDPSRAGAARNRTLCGMSRRAFFALLATLIILLLIGIGVGVGVGVSLNRPQSQDSQDDGHATSTAVLPSTIVLPTTLVTDDDATATTASVTATAPASTQTQDPSVLPGCPESDGTEFQVPGSTKSFVRYCGVDYSGFDRAIDLGHVWTASMEDCMINCAGWPGCTGCGWGAIDGDTGPEHRCWLKTTLVESSVARPAWEFARLR